MPWEPLSGGSSWYWLLPEGSSAPFVNAIPSFPFNCFFTLEVFTSQAIADEMFWAATVVAAFLICLSILSTPCQMNHKLLCYPLDSARIITLLIFIITSASFSSKCTKCTAGFLGGVGYASVSSGGRN